MTIQSLRGIGDAKVGPDEARVGGFQEAAVSGGLRCRTTLKISLLLSSNGISLAYEWFEKLADSVYKKIRVPTCAGSNK